MSKFQRPPVYTKRGQDNQWINLIHNSHDLYCGCNKPIDHLLDIINKEKWHHTTDAATTTENGGTTENQELTIDEGDLENLFSEENDVDER